MVGKESGSLIIMDSDFHQLEKWLFILSQGYAACGSWGYRMEYEKQENFGVCVGGGE